MENKEKHQFFSFRIPKELYEYIKNKSEEDFTTMSKLIISIVLKDKREREKEDGEAIQID